MTDANAIAAEWDPHSTRDVPLSLLRLDDQNPRVPEDLQGAQQVEHLRYLFDNGVLDELAASFADNGYFRQEPLLVLADGESFRVVEGNRRLAALIVLLGLEPAAAEGLSFATIELSEERRTELQSIPCHLLADRGEVFEYLGFRHIGGAKMWPPEAKARYLEEEVQRAEQSGIEPDEVFKAVGRRVGSNAQGVRNPYLALLLLRHAHQELDAAKERLAQLQTKRFGVWLRAMNAGGLKEYIGIGSPSTLTEVRTALDEVDGEKLLEVLLDLTSDPASSRKPLLADSRDVTMYSNVLVSDLARSVLRETGSLSAAGQIVDQMSMKDRILEVRDRVVALVSEVQSSDVDPDALEPAEGLARAARNLHTLIRANAENAGETSEQ